MELKKIFGNSMWQIGEKILTMLVTLVASSLIARYLGPQEYGLANYIISVVSLFTAFSTLGMQELTIKDFVNKEDSDENILGTSFTIRMIGGIVLIIISQLTLYFLNGANVTYQLLGAIMGSCMLFKAFEVIEYYLKSQMKLKISAIIRFITTIVVALAKVIVVFCDFGTIGLISTYLLDAVIVGILYYIYYKSKVSNKKWKFSKEYAKKILTQCWYIAIAGLLGTIYMRIDQIMLENILNDTTENGIYSAAVKIAEMWYFVPSAIIASFQPTINQYKILKSNEEYLKTVQKLYDIVAIIGIGFGILIMMFGGIAVQILYGAEYQSATDVLAISVWAGLFATLGSARTIWLINENLQKYTVVYTVVGATVNIVLNYLLIPKFGAIGAAITTLLSQCITNIFALIPFEKTRISSIMLLKSIFLNGTVCEIVKKFFKKNI